MSKAPRDTVVVDANVVIAICSKEAITYPKAEHAFRSYARRAWDFCAPNIVVAEVLYVLCRKVADGVLTNGEHDLCVKAFEEIMTNVITPGGGDSTLISRAVEIRASYGCSRMSDSIFLAYAEKLTVDRKVELLTLDTGMINHAAKCTPTVSVNLLTI